MSAKRPRRAAAAFKPDLDFSDEGSVTETTTKGRTNKRAGKANKKRDERSMLAEIWMLRNEAGDKPTPELKEQYADLLKIPKDEFWDVMKKYALKSKHSCVPDFEQISHHMKDRVELLQELKVQGVDFWWELDDDGCYKPNTANLKNFKPASGLLHHFYHVFIRDPGRYNHVRNYRPPGARYRVEPSAIDELVEKLSPFRLLPEPKALLVLPRHNPQLRGTYALTKKIANHNVFVRLERRVTSKTLGQLATVVVNGTSLEVPIEKAVNYAQSENGLVLYCKEEKKGGDEEGAESYRDVPFRIRVPNGRPIEENIQDLHEIKFELDGLTVVPVRCLLPPPDVAGDLDYGAVWNGCFAPFPRTAASQEEFWAHFDDFPKECFDYFFRPGASGSDHISAEDYIRFMTWFANFPGGVGQDCCNARALYDSLAVDGMPFYIQSKNEELRATQRPGAFALRLSDTKPACLTMEVLKEEDEGSPFAVLCFRIRVRFTADGGTAKSPRSFAEYALEAADGSVSVDWTPRLAGPILQSIEQLAALPPSMRLVPFQAGDLVMRVLRGVAASTPAVDNGAVVGVKRKRAERDETIAPPLPKLGMPGVSAFNDQTFDINGQQQLAASQVVRDTSNVHGGEMRGEIPPGGVTVFGRRIPMPEVTHEHSLGFALGGPDGPTRGESITREPSFTQFIRDMSLGAPIGHDHSLALGVPGRGFSDGVGRDTSLGIPRDLSLGAMSMGSFDGDVFQSREPSKESFKSAGKSQGQGNATSAEEDAASALKDLGSAPTPSGAPLARGISEAAVRL